MGGSRRDVIRVRLSFPGVVAAVGLVGADLSASLAAVHVGIVLSRCILRIVEDSVARTEAGNDLSIRWQPEFRSTRSHVQAWRGGPIWCGPVVHVVALVAGSFINFGAQIQG